MAMAHQVDDVARELGLDWTGNAADAAVTHFNRMQTQLEGLDDPFGDIATELVAVNLYRLAFPQWQTGKASALAYIVLVLITGVSNIYVKYLNQIKQG